jgi:hypothetical protein
VVHATGILQVVPHFISEKKIGTDLKNWIDFLNRFRGKKEAGRKRPVCPIDKGEQAVSSCPGLAAGVFLLNQGIRNYGA